MPTIKMFGSKTQGFFILILPGLFYHYLLSTVNEIKIVTTTDLKLKARKILKDVEGKIKIQVM